MNVFSLENISYSYGNGTPVLKDVTLDFKPGERSVILGANGTGKSTLLSLLDGLVFPQSGALRFFDQRLSEETLENSAFSMDFRKRVAFVFQNPDVQLFSSTVWDEIAFGPLQLGFEAAGSADTVEELLASLHMRDCATGRPIRFPTARRKRWPSLQASPRTRTCCSSTSRRTGWTPGPRSG